jgi:hypothetical protein
MPSSPYTNPWITDTRVRERNLKKGMVEPKELDRYLKELPDVGDKCETVTIPQPAIAGTSDEDE